MKKILFYLILVGMLPTVVHAVPTFQVYIDGATAGSLDSDEHSWFTFDPTFDLIVVGAFGSQTLSLTEVTLAVSVPEGETGRISVDGATLLTEQTLVGGTTYNNPDADADIDILTDVVGIDGYATKDFLPESSSLNTNHYPFQSDISDFLIYDVGNFSDLGTIHNYDADGGSITEEDSGEEKVFSVEIDGFSRAHFDVYGFETDLFGNKKQAIVNFTLNIIYPMKNYFGKLPGINEVVWILL